MPLSVPIGIEPVPIPPVPIPPVPIASVPIEPEPMLPIVLDPLVPIEPEPMVLVVSFIPPDELVAPWGAAIVCCAGVSSRPHAPSDASTATNRNPHLNAVLMVSPPVTGAWRAGP